MTQVLIVDDQRMPREYMERTITDSQNYEIAGSVSSADLAVTICQRQPVDLILMDVCTAGNKDGIEAAAEIKAKFPKIKILVSTDRVEITQQNNVPFRICFLDICQNLFQHGFCPAVGVCALSLRAFLGITSRPDALSSASFSAC